MIKWQKDFQKVRALTFNPAPNRIFFTTLQAPTRACLLGGSCFLKGEKAIDPSGLSIAAQHLRSR